MAAVKTKYATGKITFQRIVSTIKVHNTLLGQKETPVVAKEVATVISIDANTNMATLRTEGGEMFELPHRSRWHVGHQVICDQRWGARLEFQDCQLWESTHPATSSAQGQPVPRR